MAVFNPLPLNLHFASRVSPAKGPRSNDAMVNRRRCVLECTWVCPFQRLCADKSKRHVRIIPNTWWILDKFRIIPFISQRIITKRRGEVKTRSPCCAMRLPLLHRWCLILVVRRGLRKWVLRNGGLARSRLDKWRLEVLTDRSNMFGWNNMKQPSLVSMWPEFLRASWVVDSCWGHLTTGHSSERPERRQMPCEERCAFCATRGGLESRSTDSGLSKTGDTPIYYDILWYIMIYWWFWLYIYIYILYISMGYIIMINHVILGYTTFSYILRPMHGQPWQHVIAWLGNLASLCALMSTVPDFLFLPCLCRPIHSVPSWTTCRVPKARSWDRLMKIGWTSELTQGTSVWGTPPPCVSWCLQGLLHPKAREALWEIWAADDLDLRI